jgi:hypothetical protein
MDKRNRIRLICVLSLSIMLACGQFEALLQPTVTPQFTATPQPTNTPIPGWEKFEGRGVELWLPESFEGGNLDEDLDLIVERLKGLGPEFEQLSQTLDQNRSVFALWAFDSKVGEQGSLTSANITTEQVLSVITIDIYLDAVEKQFPPGFAVRERDIVQLGDREAGRLIADFTVSGVSGNQLLYVVKDGNNIWVISYGTSVDEFEERLPVFEQSAQTFSIQP